MFGKRRNCPEMMVVPAGTFTIGAPPDEPLRRDNQPQKRMGGLDGKADGRDV